MIYFVATPIGNLKEITYRAVEILKNSEAIFCEDTRHSMILLKQYGIEKPLYSYHKFNEKKSLDFVLSFAEKNADVSVISDAGMPCVCDPGNILVNALKERGYSYTVISGASAFVNAFVLSGFKPPFTFFGFLPEKNSERDKLLDGTFGACVFYVSVHDIKENMSYLLSKLGDRKVCLVKEISKAHETVRFCMMSDVIEDDRGEFVLIAEAVSEQNPLSSLTVEEHLNYYIGSGMNKNEAVKAVAKDRNVSKNEIYRLTLSDK